MFQQHSKFDRRGFCAFGAAVAASGLLNCKNLRATEQPSAITKQVRASMPPVVISTWNFGLKSCQASWKALQAGQSVLDAVEQGIHVAESDVENRSVGLGGIPNADGIVQLDACIMSGDRKAGSVAALEGFEHPISVARRVMEITPHVMLVGAGAAKFADEQGFKQKDLLVDREREAYQRWLKKQGKPSGGVDPVDSSKGVQRGNDRENHDTIALLAVDATGEMAGGCSTSGWGYKRSGRVGDSPIIGSGLYVDGDVGAAGATGLGEIMMRYCGSFLVVEAMRRGASPEQACVEAVKRIVAGEKQPANKLSVNFIAVAKDGTVGAAGTDAGFEYAVVSEGTAEIRKPVQID